MIYLRIAKDSKYSFLLESVVGGESVSRYSFIGAGQFFSSVMPFSTVTTMAQILSRSLKLGLAKRFLEIL
jgi:anthranilate/para-aminobenzoate synthase component I